MIEDFNEIIRSANEFTDNWNKNESIKNSWRSTNPKYINWYNQQRLAMSELLSTAWDSLDGKKILDFGCGTGFEFHFFHNLGAQYENITGIDINKKNIEEGKRQSPNLNILEYDGINIPFNDNSFDLCVCFVVFSSIPDEDLRKHLASELMRVLKPGGYIYWWDLPYIVAHKQHEKLNPGALWPGLKVLNKLVGPNPLPSTGLRSLKGLKKYISPFLDKFGHKPTHLSALIGPK